MNYVFSDGEDMVDNNSGDNYSSAISGEMTAQRWGEEGPQRAVSADPPRSTFCMKATPHW